MASGAQATFVASRHLARQSADRFIPVGALPANCRRLDGEPIRGTELVFAKCFTARARPGRRGIPASSQYDLAITRAD